jgi:hypothetical protein
MFLWMCDSLALERLVGFCYHIQSISNMFQIKLVNVKQMKSLFLTKYYAMKTYGGVNV